MNNFAISYVKMLSNDQGFVLPRVRIVTVAATQKLVSPVKLKSSCRIKQACRKGVGNAKALLNFCVIGCVLSYNYLKLREAKRYEETFFHEYNLENSIKAKEKCQNPKIYS